MALGEEIGEAYITVRYDTHSLPKDAEKAAAAGAKAFWDEFEKRSGKSLEEVFDKTGKDAERRLGDSGARSGDRFKKGFLGRLRGARNDFVNAIGVVGGGVEDIVGKGIDKAATLAGNALVNLGTKLTDLSGGSGPLNAFASGLGAIGTSLSGITGGGGIDGFILALVEVGVALTAAELLLGPIIAGVSALTGVVVALTSAIAFGLAGALLSLGPIIGAVGLGIFGLVETLTGLEDAAGDSLMKGFNKQLNAFSDRIIAGLPTYKEFVDLFKDLFKALDPLVPIIQDLVREFIKWGEAFATILQGPEMKKNFDVFAKTWPEILGNLLDTFTSITTGLLGIFRAISPGVADVTGKISDGAKAFSDWANSAKGQSSLKDFFDKATKAAGSLWGIIKNVSRIIGEVFGAGEETGKGFLDGLVDITDQWADFLGTERGQKALKQWFSDAKDLAKRLVDVISNLVKFFDTLDSPSNRKVFSNIVTGIGLIIAALEANYLIAQNTIGWIINAFRSVGGAVTTAWTAVSTFFGAIPGAVSTALSTIGSTISGWVTSVGNFLIHLWDGITSGLSTAWDAVVSFWTSTVSAFFTTITAPMRAFWSTFWSSLWKQLSPQWDKVTAFWNGTVVPFFTSKIAWAAARWKEFWSHIADGITAGWAKVTSWWNTTVVARFNAWKSAASAAWKAIWSHIADGLSAGWAKVTSWWNSTVVARFHAWGVSAGAAWTVIWSHISDGLSAGWGKITSWWSTTALPWLKSLPSKVGGIGGDIVGSILNGIINSFYKIPQWIGSQLSNLHFNIGGASFSLPFASGGMVNGATHALIGEAGPEAVVPLNRNLNQVDPSVRWLSAIAQGKASPAMASGGVAGGGVTIEQGAIQVLSPYSNPALVAEDVLDGLAVRFR